MRVNQQPGFTLIELIVTLAVLLITLSWAVPAFERLVARNAIASDIARLRTAVALARNTAVTRETTISLCPSPDQKRCTGNWSAPLLVIQGPFDGDHISASTKILKVMPEGAVSNVKFRNNYRWLRIAASGWPRGYNGTFNLCDKSGESAALVMSNTGRLRLGGSAQCDN
ncbi:MULTISPECIES: GspH/FimT family pseudopilin [Modicisalibacter]|uniref:GspH/FimT family pseudopilin n=1 Tax=Modicisalibacter TaxID=574347 RepID=UPI00100A875C|nr:MULTISPECIES: GspH/FimT family pseudopilin [Halomonadaceae]MBZ9558948.1 GspH/FimT family pseudopilin [Modicisalibacter sp. R2A 31.J]MBZ9575160.1 GspH/FimT family pseudopilin [Modicisalibacter sp. MOD 31.J]